VETKKKEKYGANGQLEEIVRTSRRRREGRQGAAGEMSILLLRDEEIRGCEKSYIQF
jgi:hypothetical protein